MVRVAPAGQVRRGEPAVRARKAALAAVLGAGLLLVRNRQLRRRRALLAPMVLLVQLLGYRSRLVLAGDSVVGLVVERAALR